MISATVIADSISPAGIRLTTIEARYPRFIHAELLTHRTFSRSSSSSRAIPIEKMLERIENDPVMPVSWGKNKSGMQADGEIYPDDIPAARLEWMRAMTAAVHSARNLQAIGVHKQIVNRLTEPFAHITTLLTATEWNHFFTLRRSEMAQPELKELADAMWVARKCSLPKRLAIGEWHTPFADAEEVPDLRDRIKVSVARCARVSYNNHNGARDIGKDLDLHDRLINDRHWSPTEHQATPTHEEEPYYRSNFKGWTQYRKCFTSEFISG